MSGKHSQVIRGLMSAKRSPLFQGRFGRMFRSLPPATFGHTESENENNLKLLGAAMSASFDPVKDGKDDEESGIPALYTYFGQFIDHDVTFDPASSLQQQNDPDALVDFRTPAFDLDNVYGRGPDDQPYMYNGNSFLLGSPLSGGGDPNAKDLPRNTANPQRALIGDPRNDENTIVSQFQGLLLRFHNRTLAGQSHALVPGSAEARSVSLPVRRHQRLPAAHRSLERDFGSEARRPLQQARDRVLPLEGRSVHAGGVFGRRLPARSLDDPAGISSQRQHPAADLSGARAGTA